MKLRIPSGASQAQLLELWRSLLPCLEPGSSDRALLIALIEANQLRPRGWSPVQRAAQKARRAKRSAERLAALKERRCSTCGEVLVDARRRTKRYCSPVCASAGRKRKAEAAHLKPEHALFDHKAFIDLLRK
jgi:hypothetical protein